MSPKTVAAMTILLRTAMCYANLCTDLVLAPSTRYCVAEIRATLMFSAVRRIMPCIEAVQLTPLV